MSDANEVLNEMLEAVPDSYQKTVGFPTWDWLAAAAIPMAGLDGELGAAKALLDPANLTGGPGGLYHPQDRTAADGGHLCPGGADSHGKRDDPAGALFESGGGVQFEALEAVAVSGKATVPVPVPHARGGRQSARRERHHDAGPDRRDRVRNQRGPHGGGVRRGDGPGILPAVLGAGPDAAHQRQPVSLSGVGHGGARRGRRAGLPPGQGSQHSGPGAGGPDRKAGQPGAGEQAQTH